MFDSSLRLPTPPGQPSPPGVSFYLNDWQSTSFDVSKIWTNETHVNPDDRVPHYFSATLNFSVPNAGGVNIGGVAVGGSIWWGLGQWGEVSWTNPSPIEVDGRIFQVTLSDEIFNEGLFGSDKGKKYGATVRATVKQVRFLVHFGCRQRRHSNAFGPVLARDRRRQQKESRLLTVSRHFESWRP